MATTGKILQKGNSRSELGGLGWLFLVSMLLHILGSVLLGFLPQKGINIPIEVELVASELTILIPSAIFILIGNYGFKEDLGFRRIKTGTFFMCILMAALVTPVASFVNVVSQLFVSNTMVQMSDTLLGGSDAALLFLGGLYGPFCEELLFRGIFFNRYDKYMGPMRAGLISAMFFALAHMNVNQAAYAFVLGMIFSVVNKAAGSVYPSMIIHVCINGMNILLLIAMNAAAENLGEEVDMVAAAEQARGSDLIYVMIAVTLVMAVISSAIAIPCVVWMAKNEGRSEDLYDMFKNRHQRAKWLTIPALLAVVIVLFMMFGLSPVLSLLGKGA